MMELPNLPDEKRWVVSFPQQHHTRGLEKEEVASKRFKRTIRMFQGGTESVGQPGSAHQTGRPSYFIKCLLYNVPNEFFAPKLAPTYTGVLDWVKIAKLKDFNCQNGQAALFGPGREQRSVKKVRAFVKALQDMWDSWS